MGVVGAHMCNLLKQFQVGLETTKHYELFGHMMQRSAIFFVNESPSVKSYLRKKKKKSYLRPRNKTGQLAFYYWSHYDQHFLILSKIYKLWGMPVQTFWVRLKIEFYLELAIKMFTYLPSLKYQVSSSLYFLEIT